MNMYGGIRPLQINSGTFWRCHHGHTLLMPCKHCGLKHPIRYIKHWWAAQ